MKAETLRKSILQWAVEGKLVPQLDTEPAVEQIGKTPEDIPFSIPEKWKWVKLGDILDYGVSSQTTPEQIPSNSWILDLEDIEKNTGNLLNKKHGIPVSSNKSSFKKGDILYGKLRPYLNKVIIADEDGYCTTEVAVIPSASFKAPLLAEYLKNYLMSPFFVNYANQCSYGVKMPRLGTKDAKAALIPIPPLEEQRRIVEKLNELLPLVESYGKEQEALEKLEKELPGKLRASLLNEAIQGKLVPQLDTEPAVEQIGKTPEDIPFSIPEKWKWVKLGDILDYGVSSQTTPEQIPSNSWILDLEDIEKNTGNLLNKKHGIPVSSNKSSFKKGDILYGKLRPYLNKVIIADEDGYCTTEVAVIPSASFKAPLLAEYLKNYLMSPFFVNYANQCSYGVKMPRLGTKDAKAALIPIPPLEEQRRIVEKLNVLFKDLDRLTG